MTFHCPFYSQPLCENVGLVRLSWSHVHCVRNARIERFRFFGKSPKHKQKFSLAFLDSNEFCLFFLCREKTTTNHTHWTMCGTLPTNCVIRWNFCTTAVSHTPIWNQKIFSLLIQNIRQHSISKRYVKKKLLFADHRLTFAVLFVFPAESWCATCQMYGCATDWFW